MTNNTKPPRQSLLREIIDLIKEHPQASKWIKILGGGYLIVQILGLLLGAAILYTIFSAFQGNKSRFRELETEFNQKYEERRHQLDNAARELDKLTEATRKKIEKWDKTKRSENFRDPRQPEDIYSPDEEDLTSSDNLENKPE